MESRYHLIRYHYHLEKLKSILEREPKNTRGPDQKNFRIKNEMQNWGKCNYSKQYNSLLHKEHKNWFKDTKNPLMINDHNLEKTNLADNIYNVQTNMWFHIWTSEEH